MLKKLQNTPITIVMFVVIFAISIISVGTMSFTSMRSANSGLFTMGNQAAYEIHKTMLNSFAALNGEIKNKLTSDLTHLESVMMEGEDLVLTDDFAQVGDFTLPVMKKGGREVYSDNEFVDGITRNTGAKATIFQLIDNKLVRISTSVIKKNGQRATGTYIDSSSPVFQTIMRGSTFEGKAFVVDDWYLTAYSPLYDSAGKIIGATFVGNLMLSPKVKELVSTTSIGNGYFYIYGKKGEFLVHPKYDSRKSIFDTVPKFKNHQGGYLEYTSSSGVDKIAYSSLYEPWGVYVAVGLSRADILQGLDRVLLKNSLIVGVFVLCIGFALNFLLVRIVNRRVSSLADVAAKVGSGDYRVRFDVQSKDALGDLSNSLNEMVANSKEMLSQITNSANSLSSASTQLSSISTELVTSSAETTDIADRTSVHASEVSSNMDSVAAASEQSATNLNMIAAASEEMGNTIQEIATNSAKASSTTLEAVEVSGTSQNAVKLLGEAANSIGKVTETITEISEQTNLLALNATIEAARAGDAGKGFAVVANEIKELAKQTADATSSIREAILEIQSQTNTTINDIGGITAVISDVNDIVQGIVTAVEEQSITTSEIVQNVNQATQGLIEVNENIANSSQMTNSVSSDVRQVQERSGVVRESSADLQEAAESLSDLAGDLTSLVGRFKV